MDDALTRLLQTPQSEWRQPDLEEAFLVLGDQYIKAMNGWNSALDECKSALEEQQRLMQLLKQSGAQFDILASLYKTAQEDAKRRAPQPKRRGRPKKREDLSWIDTWYPEQIKKFGELNDRPLIKKVFEEMYESVGLRRGHVNSKEARSQMETFRKLLVERRYQVKRLSRNQGNIPTG